MIRIGKLLKTGVDLLLVAWDLLSPAQRNAERRKQTIKDAAAKRKAELDAKR